MGGIIYYSIMLILVFGNFLFFVFTKKRYVSSLYVGLFIVMPIVCIGYLLLGLSTNAEEALVAIKFVYLGGQILPMLMFLILCRFVELKNYKKIAAICFICFFLYVCLTLSIGQNNLYYTSYEYHQENGVGYLVKTYGPLYFIKYTYMGTYMLLDIGMLIYLFTKRSSVSYKNLLYLVTTICTTITFSIIANSFSKVIDLMPIGYFVSGVVVLFLLRRMNVYNLSYAASMNLDNKDFYGCLGFDTKRNFIGSNEDAKALFPELSQLLIDYPIPSTIFFDSIRNLIDDIDENGGNPYIHLKKNDKTYKLQISKNLRGGKREYGYFIEITDDTSQIEYIQLMKNYSQELSREVEEKTESIRKMQQKIILSMANMVETRDANTGGHVKRTSDVVRILIKYLKEDNIYHQDDEFYDYVRRAAPMHDLGKITISDEILNKPGRFTPEEFSIMKTHSVMGEKMVEVVLDGIQNERFVQISKNVARFHHERYDGSGYPDGLKGENIPVEARIMAVADVYDALVTKRCYKERMSFWNASEIMRESMGNHFDPKLAALFEKARPDLEQYYKDFAAQEV